MAEPALVELRCPHDDKLLAKVSDIEGVELEIKCPRCSQVICTKRVENNED